MDHSRRSKNSPTCAHRPIPVTLTLPSRFGKLGGNGVPLDLGLNTDNGSPGTGAMSPFRTREKEKRGLERLPKDLSMLERSNAGSVSRGEGGKRHPFS